MSDSINNIETTTKTVNNSKLIEEIKSNLNNSIEQKQQEDEEETCESKPMSTLSTSNKRSYLEINETVNKYKPFMLKQLETKKTWKGQPYRVGPHISFPTLPRRWEECIMAISKKTRQTTKY